MPAQGSHDETEVAELALCSLLQTVRIRPPAAALAPDALDTVLAHLACPATAAARPRARRALRADRSDGPGASGQRPLGLPRPAAGRP